MKRAAALILALLLSLTALCEPFGDKADEIVRALTSQSGCSDTEEYVAQMLCPSAGSLSDWNAVALRQCGQDMSAYTRALERYCEEKEIRNPATRQRVALTLLLCGGKSEWIEETLRETAGTRGVMTWIYALHLINNGVSCEEFTADSVTEQLLSLQNADGGWAVSGTVSDPDVTAMALQALPDRGADEAVSRALAFLSKAQCENGGFKSYGVNNAESAAQVIIALCALGIDPQTDPRFLKNGLSAVDALEGFLRPDGGYAHTEGGEENGMATSQALCAYVALARFREGKGSLFTLDAPSARSRGGKALWYGIIALTALLACGVLCLCGKRSFKSYLAVLCAAALLCAGVRFIRLEKPSSYYGTAAERGETVGSVTLEIRCDTVKGQNEFAPADGVILPLTEVPICEGDTVYDVLVGAARKYGIQLECENASGVSARNVYVSGIAYLYEFDFGDLSGWVYRVNGEDCSVGCGSREVKDGDRVSWNYSRELGRDVP